MANGGTADTCLKTLLIIIGGRVSLSNTGSKDSHDCGLKYVHPIQSNIQHEVQDKNKSVLIGVLIGKYY